MSGAVCCFCCCGCGLSLCHCIEFSTFKPNATSLAQKNDERNKGRIDYDAYIGLDQETNTNRRCTLRFYWESCATCVGKRPLRCRRRFTGMAYGYNVTGDTDGATELGQAILDNNGAPVNAFTFYNKADYWDGIAYAYDKDDKGWGEVNNTCVCCGRWKCETPLGNGRPCCCCFWFGDYNCCLDYSTRNMPSESTMQFSLPYMVMHPQWNPEKSNLISVKKLHPPPPPQEQQTPPPPPPPPPPQAQAQPPYTPAERPEDQRRYYYPAAPAMLDAPGIRSMDALDFALV